jgi:hypothetical protein
VRHQLTNLHAAAAAAAAAGFNLGMVGDEVHQRWSVPAGRCTQQELHDHTSCSSMANCSQQ